MEIPVATHMSSKLFNRCRRMTATRLITLSYVALLLLNACENTAHSNQISLLQQQRTSAIVAANNLLKLFDKGACDMVYQQASAQFRSQAPNDWVGQCEQLRKKIGPWRTFTADWWTPCGSGGAWCLEGTAVFGKDRYYMVTGWLLKNGSPRLLYLSFARGGRQLETIPPLGPQRILVDPPPPVRLRETHG